MPIAQYTCCKITYPNFFGKRRTIFVEYSPNLSHSMHHHHQLFHDIENVFAALTYWRLRLKISCIECTCALRKVALIRVGKSGDHTGLDISPRLCSFLWQFLALSEARVPRTRAVNTYERHKGQPESFTLCKLHIVILFTLYRREL